MTSYLRQIPIMSGSHIFDRPGPIISFPNNSTKKYFFSKVRLVSETARSDISKEPTKFSIFVKMCQNSLVKSSSVWTWSPDLSRPIFEPLYVLVCLYMIFWLKKQENRPSFQSTHFTRKSPWGLLRLKLVIVNTTNFRLILGMMRGYQY